MELSWLSAILVGAGYLALGYFIGSQYPPRFLFSPNRLLPKDKDASLNSNNSSKKNNGSKSKLKGPLEIEQLADILDDFKMILVVRNDLKMGKGKIAAQCSHATLGIYKKLLYRAPKALNRWEMCAQPKVVVKIESEEDMLALQERAKSLKLPTHITIDAGRTQIAPNSRTVMAILGPVEVVDEDNTLNVTDIAALELPPEDLPCSLPHKFAIKSLVDSNDDDENFSLEILTDKSWNHETHS